MNLLKTSLLALVLLTTAASCTKDEDPVVEELNYSIDLNLANETDWDMANEILRLVNEHRVSVGLNMLQKDQQYASAYAVDHTQYMIENRKISHDNFSERVRALKDRGAASVGENVGYGYTEAQSLVTAWLNSPSHKRVLEGQYTHSGFGIMKNSQGQYYFTQLFYRN
ncbi:MAG: CAP domain-containing protein [Flavobacteriaceae bacterium]|nr:CAP domain-containing protein [Flavobacteriaceae bacterium]